MTTHTRYETDIVAWSNEQAELFLPDEQIWTVDDVLYSEFWPN
ncbi:hypothetical protein [Pectobacterium polonicum]|nr:hypothetical protein [Pectobacterium polonicum]